MIGVYFQKSLKSATALAMIFAVSSPISATQVTWTSKDHINEENSFESIATGSMNLSIRRILNHRDEMLENNQQQASETIRYLPAVEAAKGDVQAVKRSVVASNLLTYPQSHASHKLAFENLIAQVYGNTSLGRCLGDQNSPYRNQIEEISDKLFKVSQKHLANSKDRDEWINAEADLGSGGFFTFTLNNDQKNSIYVNDLNIALPLYGEHRQSNVNSLTPRGANLTADEIITAQFLNRIQSGEIPNNPFKEAIKYRRANKRMSLENLTRHMRGEDLIQAQPLVIYSGAYPRANITGQISIELEQAMRIAFPPLIEEIKRYCGYVSPRVSNAQIFDRLYDPFIEMVLERFVALKQNVRNSPYLMANTTPYGMEQDILRRFELYKRQTSAYNEWTQNPSVYGLQKAVDAYIGWRIPPSLVKTGFDLWKQYTGYESTIDGVQWIKTKEGSVGIKDSQTGLSYPIFGAERLSHENFLAEGQPMDGNGLNGMISFMGDYINQDENMKLAHVKAPLESLCYIIHETYLDMVKDHLNNRPWKEDRKRQVLMDKAEKHMQLTGISYLDQKTSRYKNGVYIKAGLMPRMLGHEVYKLPKMDKYKNDFENRYVQSFLGTPWYKLFDDQEFYFKSKK